MDYSWIYCFSLRLSNRNPTLSFKKGDVSYGPRPRSDRPDLKVHPLFTRAKPLNSPSSLSFVVFRKVPEERPPPFPFQCPSLPRPRPYTGSRRGIQKEDLLEHSSVSSFYERSHRRPLVSMSVCVCLDPCSSPSDTRSLSEWQLKSTSCW